MANQDSPNTVVVKCPQCGTQLSFKPVPNYREKPISCPRCNFKGKVKDFNFIKPAPVADGADGRTTDPDGMPAPESPRTAARAYIRCIETGEEFELHPGPTTIGRRTAQPKAEILFTDPDRFMSRQHVTITLVDIGGHPELHLKDTSVNGTFIKGNRMPEKSVIKLAPGEQFKMGSLSFVCRLENDDDKTRLKTDPLGKTDGRTTLN